MKHQLKTTLLVSLFLFLTLASLSSQENKLNYTFDPVFIQEYGYSQALVYSLTQDFDLGLHQGFIYSTEANLHGEITDNVDMTGGLEWNYKSWQSFVDYKFNFADFTMGAEWSNKIKLPVVDILYSYSFEQDNIAKREDDKKIDLGSFNSLSFVGNLYSFGTVSSSYYLDIDSAYYLESKFNYSDIFLRLPFEWAFSYPVELALQAGAEQYLTHDATELNGAQVKGNYYKSNFLTPTSANNQDVAFTSLAQLESELRFFARFLPHAAKQIYLSLYGNIAYLGDNETHSNTYQYLYGAGLGWKMFDSVPFNMKVVFDKNQNLTLNLFISSVAIQ